MAAPDFTGFANGALAFLTALRDNNSREWFADNKKTYETALKKPAEAFSALMADELERLTGAPVKAKIFRINRDIRFSKDKSPYNAHLHLSWTASGAGEGAPAFMFGLSPDYLTAGCGAFAFPPAMLDAWRAAIAGADGEEIARLLDTLGKQGFRQSEPELKRPAAGFAADHPNAALSRHKGLAVWGDFESPDAASDPDILRAALSRFEALLPLWHSLSRLSAR